MAAVTIEKIGDWTLADDGWKCAYEWADYRNQFQGVPVLTPRAGSSPALGQGSISARTMPVQFTYTGDDDDDAIGKALETLAGRLNLDDPTPRRIVGTAFDNADVQITAAVSMTSGWDDAMSQNIVLASLVSGSPRWEVTTTDVLSARFTNCGQSPAMSVLNAGYATVEPVILLQPFETEHLSTTETVGWQYRRPIVFTNNTAQTWDRPLRFDLGNTTGWDALSSGDDVRIELDGEELPRTLIAWNYAQTFAWVVPPLIAPGETVTFYVIYGNPSAGSPEVLSGKRHPSFIYEFDTGTTSSARSTTQLDDSSKTWDLTDINFVGGYLMMLGGPNVGLTREVTEQHTNTINCDAFPSAIGSGHAYLLFHSSNERWWFNVGEWFDASAGTAVRGLWYLNQRTHQPTDVDFDVPGSWRPYLMNDNGDRFAQKSVTIEGGRYFAQLDAYRTWQGGGPSGQLTNEDGIADGVMFRSCVPITYLYLDFNLTDNLNAMCQAVIMAKASGAEAWELISSTSPAGDFYFESGVVLPVDSEYFFLYLGLLPSDDGGVIRTDRSHDSGSTSDDGAARTIDTLGTGTHHYLRTGSTSSSLAVRTTDTVPVIIDIPNSTTVTLDGRIGGDWRGVRYNDGSGNAYTGWLNIVSDLDTGMTAGGNTAIDGSKLWVTNELVGAQFKITGSQTSKALVGRSHTITANDETTITVGTPFAATVTQGTAYEIIQSKTTVKLQSATLCYVDFDTSDISLSAAGSEENVYQFACELSVGDGGQNLFERKVSARVGLDGRRVFAAIGEQVMIDGANRKAAIVGTDDALTFIRGLTDPAVLVQQEEQDLVNRRVVTKRAARWLPLVMGYQTDAIADNKIVLANVDPGWTCTLSKNNAAGSWDPVTSDGFAYMLEVTANTGGTDSGADILADHLIPFNPGQRVSYSVAVETNNANLQPRLGIVWFDHVGTELSTSYQTIWTPVINTWLPAAFEMIGGDPGSQVSIAGITASSVIDGVAPTGATQAKWVVRVVSKSGSQTGRVRVGNTNLSRGFYWEAPKLWVNEIGQNDVGVTVRFRRGYLG